MFFDLKKNICLQKYETNQLYVDEEMKKTKSKKQVKKEEKPLPKPTKYTLKNSPYNKALPPISREAMVSTL